MILWIIALIVIAMMIFVPEATTRLVTGQTVSIDDASGVIQVQRQPRITSH